MSAHFVFINHGRELVWHVNQKPPFNFEDIKNITIANLSGDELIAVVNHLGLKLDNHYGNRFMDNEAKLVAFIIWIENKDKGAPTITEEGINTVLSGKNNPKQN